MVGSQIREGNLNINPSSHVDEAIELFLVSILSLSLGCYPAMVKTLAEILYRYSAQVG
jgi:hypothetical protein